jgi:hypothetical protein
MRELLASAKTENEKIALLKEIQRLSEQIEQLKIEENDLLRKAAFSTIVLHVSNIPQEAVPVRLSINAFEWFSNLIFVNEYSNMKKALKLEAPKYFLETSDTRKRWGAASAMGAKFWAFEKENEPQGSADFWAAAMLEYFESIFKAELKSEENFSLVRLQNFEQEPKIYYIAILKTSDKKKLKIAQAYFPSLEIEKRSSESVKEVLRRVK